MKGALLAPFSLSVSLATIGLLGNLILPGWWLPILLIMAIASIIDMTQDFYKNMKIRAIGERGKYWDTGQELKVVWKA